MEVIIDFEFLRGRHNEIVKELSVAAANVSETIRFKSPYIMASEALMKTGSTGKTVL